MHSLRSCFLGLTLAAVGTATPIFAGAVSLTWDATPGATGYYVYYGTASRQYNQTLTTSTTSATISGLQDCTTYYFAVKAFNQSGASAEYSNEVFGWARPGITTATPASAMQGDQVVMDVTGAN